MTAAFAEECRLLLLTLELLVGGGRGKTTCVGPFPMPFRSRPGTRFRRLSDKLTTTEPFVSAGTVVCFGLSGSAVSNFTFDSGAFFSRGTFFDPSIVSLGTFSRPLFLDDDEDEDDDDEEEDEDEDEAEGEIGF